MLVGIRLWRIPVGLGVGGVEGVGELGGDFGELEDGVGLFGGVGGEVKQLVG